MLARTASRAFGAWHESYLEAAAADEAVERGEETLKEVVTIDLTVDSDDEADDVEEQEEYEDQQTTLEDEVKSLTYQVQRIEKTITDELDEIRSEGAQADV